MKIVFLAAGRGSRMSNVYMSPKPLIKVKGRSLIWWSLQAFHEILTCGLIRKEDIKIVILKEHKKHFREDLDLERYFNGLDPYIELPKLTSGPLETAAIAVDDMIQKRELNLNEQIIFSDSDHFARSIAIRRSLEKLEDLYLWETKKGPGLEWSFVDRTKANLEIVEKPKTENGLDTSRGLVGIYGFGKAYIFKSYAQEILSRPFQYERYMSDVINKMLADNLSARISEIMEFVPMGTPLQISEATRLDNPDYLILDSPNFFIDIDGVLLQHNSSVHGRETWEPDKPISANIQELNEAYKFGRIILVTARPKSKFLELKKSLDSYSIKFDEIVSGCTGGVRILVNDKKPKLPFLDTAISINILRNGQMNLRFAQKELSDISGGSGAKTFIINNSQPKVIKFSTNPNDAGILNFQANWYEFCDQNSEIETLKVVKRYSGSNGIFGYMTEFRANLVSFYDFALKSGFNSSSNILTEGFQKMYVNNIEPRSISDALLNQIIKEKVLPSIRLTISKFSHNDRLCNELKHLASKFESCLQSKILQRMAFRGAKSLIHGDSTFENLQVDIELNQLVFVDPVGKMIEPGISNLGNFDSFSFPVFDLARLELSFRLNYENHIKLSEAGDILEMDCLSMGQASIGNKSILETEIANVYSNYFTENLDMVLATTVGRILKYKKNEKEILILTSQARQLIEGII